jgi:hypothetical protein
MGYVFGSQSTREELLTAVFGSLGPVVCLGRLNEELPPFGAARIYVRQGDWQELISDLMGKSAAVILQAGVSEGIRWELEQAVQLLRPGQLILYLPMRGRWFTSERLGEYAVFREWANRFFRKPLPEKMGSACIVYFDEEWTPYLLEAGHGGVKIEWSAVPFVQPHPLAGQLQELADKKRLAPEKAFFHLEVQGFHPVIIICIISVLILTSLLGIGFFLWGMLGSGGLR